MKQEDYEAIIKMGNNGHTAKEISSELGITKARFYAAIQSMRKHGIVVPYKRASPFGRKRKFDFEALKALSRSLSEEEGNSDL